MRAFLAIKIPITPGIGEALSELLGFTGVNVVQSENIHVTIKFLGEIDEGNVSDISKALLPIVSGTGPFELEMKGTGTFSRNGFPSTVWLGLPGGELPVFMASIDEALFQAGISDNIRKASRLKPHITIGRVKNRSPSLQEKLCCFIDKWTDYSFGSIEFSCLFLFKSILTPAGPIYYVLEEYPMGMGH